MTGQSEASRNMMRVDLMQTRTICFQALGTGHPSVGHCCKQHKNLAGILHDLEAASLDVLMYGTSFLRRAVASAFH